MKSNKYGLLLAMMEPPEEMEEEFNEWYDTEHIPERMAVPGILSAQRFVAYKGFPRYLALYDLESLKVLQSKAYKRIGIDNLSPWSRRIIRYARGFRRNVYKQIFPGMAKISGRTNAVVLWAYEIYTNKEKEFNQWYKVEFVPYLKGIDGFTSVRRFICDEGWPKYLELFEFKDVNFLKSDSYKKVILFEKKIKIKKYFRKSIYILYKKYTKKLI